MSNKPTKPQSPDGNLPNRLQNSHRPSTFDCPTFDHAPSLFFIETLKITDGHFLDPRPHLARIHATLAECGITLPALPAFRDEDIPAGKRTGCVKCRCTYGTAPLPAIHPHHLPAAGANGTPTLPDSAPDSTPCLRIDYEPYTPRPIRSLRLVACDGIDYHLKYADRRPLLRLLEQRGGCDDILIVRHGLLTDTSYANIALWDGTRYYTPARPLLPGTRRAALLAAGVLHEAPLRPSDLPRFRTLHLLNAMLDFPAILPDPSDPGHPANPGPPAGIFLPTSHILP